MSTKLSQKENSALETVILRLQALVDPHNTGCGIEPEHKEGVRLYVQSWITPVLEAILTPVPKGLWSPVDAAAGDLFSHRAWAEEARKRKESAE